MVLIPRSSLLLMAFTAVSTDVLAVWAETFAHRSLDLSRWELTADGDFREWAVDVVDLPRGSGDFRLSLGADTRGTRDDTVKFFGVRGVPLIRLDEEVRISVDIDWNNQVNGSYLSAAVVLSPHATTKSPLKRPDWFKVEYVGVPPGKNARIVIGLKKEGREQTLYNEGWPEDNRAGRKIGLQQVGIVLHDQVLQVWENNKLLYDSKEKVLYFDAAYLYLQMSSHSNYPQRTIYFDNIRVRRARCH